ncbi:hypothetical protein LTR53_007453 [Teratosphaeriaceae sp. CCFEE 6253]|nr:hypothetical protein LTR53_007453 [Teratosphaeriaceae sp. CCFEE 6253]
MVLEGATTNDSFSASDTVPTSDFDPYESTAHSPISTSPDFFTIRQTSRSGQPLAADIRVNANDLPQPWSLFGQARLKHTLVKGINDQCAFIANTLQRPATQEEANAVAFHFAKTVRIASYGSPAGIAVATAVAYRGNSKYRFPGWTPIKEGGQFSKDVFGPLRGFQARVVWQGARLSAYALVGTVLGQLFFASYALSISVAGRSMDPRLKEFNEALRQKAKSGLGKERDRRVEDESAGPKGTETYDMARQRRSAQDLGRRGRQQVSAAGTDDASPTGGAFSDDFSGADEVGFVDERQVQKAADSQVGSSRDRRSPTASAQSTNPSSQSPRAPRESQTRPSSGGGGSAWDRVRQGAISSQPGASSNGMAPSGPAGSRAPAQSSGDALGDSFSFSAGDADRQLAKSEAQSEFDARMERERAGKDFSERGGGGKW